MPWKTLVLLCDSRCPLCGTLRCDGRKCAEPKRPLSTSSPFLCPLSSVLLLLRYTIELRQLNEWKSSQKQTTIQKPPKSSTAVGVYGTVQYGTEANLSEERRCQKIGLVPCRVFQGPDWLLSLEEGDQGGGRGGALAVLRRGAEFRHGMACNFQSFSISARTQRNATLRVH